MERIIFVHSHFGTTAEHVAGCLPALFLALLSAMLCRMTYEVDFSFQKMMCCVIDAVQSLSKSKKY